MIDVLWIATCYVLSVDEPFPVLQLENYRNVPVEFARLLSPTSPYIFQVPGPAVAVGTLISSIYQDTYPGEQVNHEGGRSFR